MGLFFGQDVCKKISVTEETPAAERVVSPNSLWSKFKGEAFSKLDGVC